MFGVAAGGGWAWLAVVGAAGSVVSFGYYGSVVRSAWFDEGAQSQEAPGGAASTGPATWVTAALAIAILLLGVAPLLDSVSRALLAALGSS